jgi:hypothetical protein
MNSSPKIVLEVVLGRRGEIAPGFTLLLIRLLPTLAIF